MAEIFEFRDLRIARGFFVRRGLRASREFAGELTKSVEPLADTIDGCSAFVHLLEAGAQNLAVGFGANWEPHVVITDEKALVVVMKGKPLVFEHLAVGISKNRKKNARALKRVGTPVDIEVRREFGLLTVFKHIHPPRVFLAYGHMVGNDVQYQAHFIIVQTADQLSELLLSSQLRIHARRVGDVVAVEASFAGTEAGRGIKVGDTEGVQIGDEFFRIDKAKVKVKLNAISSAKMGHGSRHPHS